MLNNLTSYDVVLASNSPRRQELLQMSGVSFRSEVVSNLSEDFSDQLPLLEVAEWLATNKMTAYQHLWQLPNKIVITADTVVLLNNKIINKPANKAEAIEMLTALSGNVHKVITGVAVKSSHKEVVFKDVTKVWFRPLQPELIEYYVENFKPFDKAGGYGIQEWIGLVGIRKIEGSYFNVMGLPIDLLFDTLRTF